MATVKKQQQAVIRVLWTGEMEDRLDDMRQEHDCLYNISSKTYHNQMEKEKSLTKATCCTISVSICFPMRSCEVVHCSFSHDNLNTIMQCAICHYFQISQCMHEIQNTLIQYAQIQHNQRDVSEVTQFQNQLGF